MKSKIFSKASVLLVTITLCSVSSVFAKQELSDTNTEFSDGDFTFLIDTILYFNDDTHTLLAINATTDAIYVFENIYMNDNKISYADLSDYAGDNINWDAANYEFDATGGGLSSYITNMTRNAADGGTVYTMTSGDKLLVNDTITATGDVTGANLNVANWDTAFGWGDHSGLYSLLGHWHDYTTSHYANATFAKMSWSNDTFVKHDALPNQGVNTTDSPTFLDITLTNFPNLDKDSTDDGDGYAGSTGHPHNQDLNTTSDVTFNSISGNGNPLTFSWLNTTFAKIGEGGVSNWTRNAADGGTVYTTTSGDKVVVNDTITGTSFIGSGNPLTFSWLNTTYHKIHSHDYIPSDYANATYARMSWSNGTFMNITVDPQQDDLSDNTSTQLMDTADLLYEAELDSEAELEGQLADVNDVITNNDAAGGDLSGNYPNPQVVDDSHNHVYSNIDETTSDNWKTVVSDEIDEGYEDTYWLFGDQGVGTLSDVTFNSVSGDGSGLTNIPKEGNPFNQELNTSDDVTFNSISGNGNPLVFTWLNSTFAKMDWCNATFGGAANYWNRNAAGGGTLYTKTDGDKLLVNDSVTAPSFYTDDYIYHTGDTDTCLTFTDDRLRLYAGNKLMWDMQENAVQDICVGGEGLDVDFKWGGLGGGILNLFYADYGLGRVGINTGTPSYLLDVQGDCYADDFIGDGSALTFSWMNSTWANISEESKWNRNTADGGTLYTATDGDKVVVNDTITCDGIVSDNYVYTDTVASTDLLHLQGQNDLNLITINDDIQITAGDQLTIGAVGNAIWSCNGYGSFQSLGDFYISSSETAQISGTEDTIITSGGNWINISGSPYLQQYATEYINFSAPNILFNGVPQIGGIDGGGDNPPDWHGIQINDTWVYVDGGSYGNHANLSVNGSIQTDNITCPEYYAGDQTDMWINTSSDVMGLTDLDINVPGGDLNVDVYDDILLGADDKISLTANGGLSEIIEFNFKGLDFNQQNMVSYLEITGDGTNYKISTDNSGEGIEIESQEDLILDSIDSDIITDDTIDSEATDSALTVDVGGSGDTHFAFNVEGFEGYGMNFTSLMGDFWAGIKFSNNYEIASNIYMASGDSTMDGRLEGAGIYTHTDKGPAVNIKTTGGSAYNYNVFAPSIAKKIGLCFNYSGGADYYAGFNSWNSTDKYHLTFKHDLYGASAGETWMDAKLTVDGSIVCTDLTETSDYRVKYDFTEVDNATILKLCRNLNLYLFKYKDNELLNFDDGGGFGYGPVAQEVYNQLLDAGFSEEIAGSIVKVGNSTTLWSINNNIVQYIFARGWQINDDRLTALEDTVFG